MGCDARYLRGGKSLAVHVVEVFGLAVEAVVHGDGQIVDDRLESAAAVRKLSDQST